MGWLRDLWYNLLGYSLWPCPLCGERIGYKRGASEQALYSEASIDVKGGFARGTVVCHDCAPKTRELNIAKFGWSL